VKKNILPASSLDFLQLLAVNNDREWFARNKTAYQTELACMETFVDALLQQLNQYDVIETPSAKKSLYRIYRDVRFSKDKTPFSTYWGGRFRRAGKQRRGGYYYHFEPGNKSFVLAGFWAPNAQDLKLIRDDIAFDPEPLCRILGDETFIGSFGKLQGEKLKTSPNGYDRNHEAVDLLRFKQFLVKRSFSDKEVLCKDFLLLASQAFQQMRPFLDYMSEVLSAETNSVLAFIYK
jgi:uncharacterized protein (TIGR02453 family)